MTLQQIKTEIQKSLDNVPEHVLQEILDYLKSVKGKDSTQVQRSINLRKILTEDKNLLQRLAK